MMCIDCVVKTTEIQKLYLNTFLNEGSFFF